MSTTPASRRWGNTHSVAGLPEGENVAVTWGRRVDDNYFPKRVGGHPMVKRPHTRWLYRRMLALVPPKRRTLAAAGYDDCSTGSV